MRKKHSLQKWWPHWRTQYCFHNNKKKKIYFIQQKWNVQQLTFIVGVSLQIGHTSGSALFCKCFRYFKTPWIRIKSPSAICLSCLNSTYVSFICDIKLFHSIKLYQFFNRHECVPHISTLLTWFSWTPFRFPDHRFAFAICTFSVHRMQQRNGWPRPNIDCISVMEWWNWWS